MFQLPIKSVDDAKAIGQAIAQSGMFGVNNDGAGTVIALMCYQRGISLDEYERTWQFVSGKRSMKYDVMLAKLLELGGDYEIVERTEKVASVKVKRAGKEYTKTYTLTMEEAIASGVACAKDGKTLKDQYRIRPKAMLFSKVVADAIRVEEPRVNFGVYSTEEVEDFDEHPQAPDSSHNNAPVPFTPPNPQAATQQAPVTATQMNDAPATTQPAQATEDPFKDVPQDEVDYYVCPIGPKAGTKWENMPRAVLQAIQKDPRTLTKQHLAAIEDILERMPF